jgi:hypothetical protein
MTYEAHDGATLLRAPELLPDPTWTLVRSERNVRSGRCDYLFRDSKGRLHLVEMKTGVATVPVVRQVRDYADDLEAEGTPVTPWIIGNSIPPNVHRRAEAAGVRAHCVLPRAYERARNQLGLPPIDLSMTAKRMPAPTSDLTSQAVGRLPRGMAAVIQVAERRFGLRVSTTRSQRIRIFCPTSNGKGVLLGGVLPSGNHAYISKGAVASSAFRAQLRNLGFQRDDPHHHRWTHRFWNVPLTENYAFILGLKTARALVLTSLAMTAPAAGTRLRAG